MAKMVEIAELMEKHGKDWRKYYNPGVRGKARVFLLYLGLFVVVLYVLAAIASPVVVIVQGVKISRIERELAAERRLVDQLLPPRPSIRATR